MIGVLLGLGSSVSWGISDLLGGMMARRLPVAVVLYVSQPVGLVLALLAVIVIGDRGLSLTEALPAAGAGAFALIGLGAFYRGLAIGPISVVATISSLGVLVPVGVGLGGGESISAIAAAGIALAVAGAVLVSREPGEALDRAGGPAIALAVLAALGFGGYFVGIDAAAEDDAGWAVVAARAGGVAALLAAWPLLRPNLRLARPQLAPLGLIGTFDVTANALFALATTQGLLSLVAPAASLYAAVTVILAWMVLDERISRIRALGIVVAIAGVILIASQS